MIRVGHFVLLLTAVCGLAGCGGSRSEIKALYADWQGAIAKGNFDAAYLMMTQEYRAKNTVEQFRDRYTRLFVPPPLNRDAVVRAPAPGGGVLNGTVYGVARVDRVWGFTGIDGGYNQIVGDK